MTKDTEKFIKIELTEEEINKRIDQIESLNCDQELRDFLIMTLRAIISLDQIIGMKNTTIARLRKIFGKKSEKSPPKTDTEKQGKNVSKGRNPGQGNNGKDDYPLATRIFHSIDDSQRPGKKCIECGKGSLSPYTPGIFIRVSGAPNLSAVIHETEKSRCNACGAIFEADFDGKDKVKYDESSKAIIAILHYLASIPFYRLEKIQKMLLTPMPRSVQWKLMEDLANNLIFIWKAIIKFAREGDLFCSDDTGGKILSVMKENKGKSKKDRTKIHTTGIIAKRGKTECILFFTGIKYSGENLDDLLEGRETDKPIALMSDALNQNNPKTREDIIRYLCLIHGRRNFIDLEEKFQQEVSFIKGEIALIYKHEKYCKDQNLTDDERLEYHKKFSGPVMDSIHHWCESCFENKLVEPNSSLGKGIKYLLNHWEGLTGFLKYPGALIDNNKLEGHLRVPVLNRKNWLFYKTELGALVGDIILSILKTCEMNKIDPYRYLIYVQENFEEVKKNPERFLPWKVIFS